MTVSALQTEVLARVYPRELPRQPLHLGIVEVEDGRSSEVSGVRGRIGGVEHCG